MNYQEDLLMLWWQDAHLLSEQEIRRRTESAFSKTFSWMAGLLLLAFGTARSISSGLLPVPISGWLFMLSAFGWLGLVFYMSRRWHRLSYETLAGLLVLFALLEWYGLTGIFFMYNVWSIYQVFLTSALMFAWLAVAWWRMNIDVTKVWPILLFGLIGLIIASVINMFRWNAQFDIWISIIWLVIFSWFVIYDMNVLKQQALINDERMPLLMALGLFINFINIFLFLLRLMWGRE